MCIEGGPGWHIDADTLLPVIDDEQEFRTAHADDPALEVLVAHWSGDLHRARAALTSLLAADPGHWRWRALAADIRRDLGDHQTAIAEYRSLVEQNAGTTREAVLLQHLGKAHFAAGQYEAAAACFERALELRAASGADRRLLESSRAALDRARRRAADGVESR